MTQQEKDTIREALRVYAAKYSSQKKAAASLNGVSAGTLSAVINGKYENISDDMFRNIIAQITPAAAATGWQLVETNSFQEIWYALSDAQEFKKVRWIVGGAGCGKTTTATMYAQKIMRCSSYFVMKICGKVILSGRSPVNSVLRLAGCVSVKYWTWPSRASYRWKIHFWCSMRVIS